MLLLFDLEEDDDCDIILSFPKKDFVEEVEDVCNFMMMMISFYELNILRYFLVLECLKIVRVG